MATRKVLSAISLVLVSAAALVVCATSSPTRGDLVFGLGAWLVFVVFATACGSVMLGLLFGVRRLLKRRMARDSAMAIATMVIGAAAAFPVSADWEEEAGHRASGLVPAAQALMLSNGPRSGWNAERPRDPIVAYAYTCCG